MIVSILVQYDKTNMEWFRCNVVVVVLVVVAVVAVVVVVVVVVVVLCCVVLCCVWVGGCVGVWVCVCGCVCVCVCVEKNIECSYKCQKFLLAPQTKFYDVVYWNSFLFHV